jgi:hypothetical protein
LRRGKCDAIPEGQEPRAGKPLPCKADLSGPAGADVLAALFKHFVATGSIGVSVPTTLKSPTTTSKH